MLKVGLIGAIALVVGAAGWRLADFEPEPGPQVQAGEVSVAVLPLADLSPAGDQAYFSDGMTDALSSNLGGISALRVISRTSVMKYKDARSSAPEVAQELGVTHVVDGSVLRAEGKVRITVQLIDAPADHQLWSKSYERDLADILVLQREVARDVADGIQVQLTGIEEARLTNKQTVSPAAHEAYLRGHDALSRLQVVEAIDHLTAAVEEEPDFALAHTWLGYAYGLLTLGFTERSPRVLAPRGQASLQKALELDPTLADAHWVLGNYKLNYEWDWAGAASAFRQTLKLNPSHVETRVSYSFLLMITGSPNEGFREVAEARRLDPLSQSSQLFEAWYHDLTSEHGQAIEKFHALLQRAPDSWLVQWHLAISHALKGLHAEALDLAEKAKTQAGDDLRPLATCGWIMGLSGDIEGAMAIARELEELDQRRYVPRSLIALVYLGLNENAKALDWLEAAVSQRDPLIVILMVSPRYAPLHSEPRYEALLQRMGFRDAL